jgi:hypothetical protein
MIIAKRSPLMHRQLGREPGLIKHYTSLVAVCVAALTAAAFTVAHLSSPRPVTAASIFEAETASEPVSAQTSIEPTVQVVPASGEPIADTAVDDVNARVIATLR